MDLYFFNLVEVEVDHDQVWIFPWNVASVVGPVVSVGSDEVLALDVGWVPATLWAAISLFTFDKCKQTMLPSRLDIAFQ